MLNPDLSEQDTNQHVKVPFFCPKLLRKSEFIFRNQLITLKETDLIMMNEALTKREEEEKSRLAQEKQAQQQNTQAAAGGKKPDPKAAAAKGKDAKKGAPADDPNQPKDL